jgi:hypothetical protein
MEFFFTAARDSLYTLFCNEVRYPHSLRDTGNEHVPIPASVDHDPSIHPSTSKLARDTA